jgi:hypothetical protein
MSHRVERRGVLSGNRAIRPEPTIDFFNVTNAQTVIGKVSTLWAQLLVSLQQHQHVRDTARFAIHVLTTAVPLGRGAISGESATDITSTAEHLFGILFECAVRWRYEEVQQVGRNDTRGGDDVCGFRMPAG